MDRTTLGRSGIEVSAWCLGTMTWGRQTDETDAHAQIDRALDAGIDFLDTAEMYPVNPVLAETIGDTERILGNWIRRTGRRDEMVIATKCSGPSDKTRDGAPITPETLRQALDESLARLGTDHVDLYQLHWPNRGSYHFRQIWGYDPSGQDRGAVVENIAAVAETLADLRAEGKIRAFGLSNDTAWGTMQWQWALDRAGAPRVDSVQNEYSLLCRLYDGDMAELSHHEGITLLAYSPLAAGFLTGKYQDGGVPAGSRMEGQSDLNGRVNARSRAAVDAYHAIAADADLDPVHMALAWMRTRPMHCIPIVGATTMQQLEHMLSGTETRLSDDLVQAIDTTHRHHPMPF